MEKDTMLVESNEEKYLISSNERATSDFLEYIQEPCHRQYISTGLSNLDMLLDMGLHPGLYVLGAPPSIGATTLLLQIADQIAESGTDVLIFSLEMARTELIGKAISRHTFTEALEGWYDVKEAKSYRGITTGSRYKEYTESEKELIELAWAKYASYCDKVYTIEGDGSFGVNQIREAIQKHIDLTGKTPVVFIDYLQIIAPYSEEATDEQNTDKAVIELRRISRDYSTPVICTSSINRKYYKKPVTMEAFKESSAIEYSSDVLLGLQFKGIGEKNFNIDFVKRRSCREIEVVILKNRYYFEENRTLMLYYFPKFNYFSANNLRGKLPACFF